ncbi:hypothetical protein N7481_005318 [Penicillium waksmanii]|uniref:uncharacterized protein n=1 Tax=Penicillium waksmanii TaxID=69791 RepID=UPI0025472833|nr:uncharacterized protein N7481_005318 [Penicillium waksmanii]KAJ5983219.1 hypothetical protein N7481_005318 [Penicillium waksmanii]
MFCKGLSLIAKIAGPALLIYISRNSPASSGVQIAAQILYQIALGPLMSATLSFINIFSTTDDIKAGPAYSPLAPSNGSSISSLILRLVHPVIIVGLVMGIIGGIDRMPDSSTGAINPDKYDRGATLSKVSAAMFLIAFAAIVFGVMRLWKHRKSLTTVSYYIITGMPIILPLLFLRILYSLLNAANLDTTGHTGHTTRLNIMTGSWAIYFIMGFIPQATIITMYVGGGLMAYMKIRSGRRM